MIMLFLLLVAAIVTGAYFSRMLRKSPCGCKDAAAPAGEPQKV